VRGRGRGGEPAAGRRPPAVRVRGRRKGEGEEVGVARGRRRHGRGGGGGSGRAVERGSGAGEPSGVVGGWWRAAARAETALLGSGGATHAEGESIYRHMRGGGGEHIAEGSATAPPPPRAPARHSEGRRGAAWRARGDRASRRREGELDAGGDSRGGEASDRLCGPGVGCVRPTRRGAGRSDARTTAAL